MSKFNTFFVIGLGLVVTLVGLLATQTLFTVHQTEQALIVQLGEPKRVIKEPGLHFKLPLIQNVVKLDKRVLTFDIRPEEIIAVDQKRLVVDAFSRFQITDPLKFYKTLGSVRVAKTRLNSLINSAVRKVLGTSSLGQILSEERDDLMQRIRNDVNAEVQALGLIIVDVRITRADLPKANSLAIYRRMQTERQREAKELRAKGAEVAQQIYASALKERTIILAEANKKSEILHGEGVAEGIRILNEASKASPDFYLFVRNLDAYKQSMSSKNTQIILSPTSEFFELWQATKQ